MTPNYLHYSDFLKDKHFIRWQLAPDEQLDSQWQDFIEKNPHLHEEIKQAIDYLKTTGLNNNTFNEIERWELLKKIQSTIERNSKKIKIRKIIQYSVASCAAAILVAGLTLFVSQEKKSTLARGQELIVGELLNSEDIQLITSEESLSFQSDVQVEFDESGKAKITQSNNTEERTLELTKSKQNTLIVPYGKRSTLTLSDGSKVWLNSGSVIEFPTQFIGENREIKLASGEMYIEVAPNKNKSFYVHTSSFNVKVYGTKFNISTYSGSSQSVVLVEGRVSLESSSNKETFLSPNEQAIYSKNGTFSTQKVDANQFISWKDGYLAFDKTPMTEVLQQIGRYYNLSFNYEQDINLQKRTCTGKIYLSENLDNVMTTVGLLSSTKYTKNNNQIFIINEHE